VNVLSGCSGIGGLDLGFKAAGGYRTVCYIEWEAYPQSVLLDRMREGLLDSAPIWNDFKTFDGRPWRGVVDIFVAGIPCQPHSHAGKRGAASDDRNLWPDMRRITSEVEPRVVVVENVPGLFSGPQAYGFQIVGELQELGYVVVKRTLSARSVGAPHLRERVFVIGIRVADGRNVGNNYEEQVFSGRSSSNLCSDTRTVLPTFDAFKQVGSVEELFGRSDIPEPLIRRSNDGLPYRMDRIKGIGNAVVPQVAFQIAEEIKMIIEVRYETP